MRSIGSPRPYAFNGRSCQVPHPKPRSQPQRKAVFVSAINQLPFPPACVAAGLASVEADYAAAVAAIPSGSAKAQGLLLGEAAAAAILAVRVADGWDTPLVDSSYPQGVIPGGRRFVPGVDFAFAGWANDGPFVLSHSAQFRASPPYRIRSNRFTADFNEVKLLGGDDVTTPSARTRIRPEIGRFWMESSPLAWNRLAEACPSARGSTSGRTRGCSVC